MSTERPPTIDPAAAARWSRHVQTTSPWLHEEVARRMEDRLQWIVTKPQSWVHWEPMQGGVQAHALLAKRYPQAACYVVNSNAAQAEICRKQMSAAWWTAARWTQKPLHFEAPKEPVNMLWANMALHMADDPQALIQHWHDMLAVDGFLMFSCLGPDSLRQIRRIYAQAGWPPPGHEFTDMHDWGDMLVRAGFAEPVMDMERITLSFTSPQTLLEELRGLGRNLHTQRFPALRGKGWHRQLQSALAAGAVGESGRLELTFEINYGHAFKPAPKWKVKPETTMSLDEMRRTLKQGKPG
jgi:malonyl-CoA O-methyltransferase